MPYCVALEIGGADHPGCSPALLLGRQTALVDETANGCFADFEAGGGLLERDLAAFGTLARTVRLDAVVVAQPAHASAGPAVAAPGLLSSPVEQARDGLVGHLPRHYRDEVDDIQVGAPAVLAGPVLAHPQGCMVAARPSDHQVERIALNPDHDLLDQRADDPLACRRRVAGAVPGRLDVGAERKKALAPGLGGEPSPRSPQGCRARLRASAPPPAVRSTDTPARSRRGGCRAPPHRTAAAPEPPRSAPARAPVPPGATSARSQHGGLPEHRSPPRCRAAEAARSLRYRSRDRPPKEMHRSPPWLSWLPRQW